jgi:hypothetical protein
VAPKMGEDEANARWVNLALADPRVPADTVRIVKEKRVGSALIMNPFDSRANEDAIRQGIELVSTRGWDPEVVQRFRAEAGWATTSETFPGPRPGDAEPIDETDGMRRTRAFIEQVADVIGLTAKPQVSFVILAGAWANADCGGRAITFYVNRTGPEVFDTPNPRLLYLVAHEMAHIGPDSGNPYTDHDLKWAERMGHILAEIALDADVLKVLRGDEA